MKRLVALVLVLLLSIESFGAVVSDNDGSAFITKAEFDSLKINFQSQIDQYNTSIDSKIDGAIASYLSGIRVNRTTVLNLLQPGEYEAVSYNDTISNNVWRYKYGSPMIYMEYTHWGASNAARTNCCGITWTLPYPTYAYNKHGQHKLLLSSVNDLNGTAEWYGFSFASSDKINLINGTGNVILYEMENVSNYYMGYFRPSYNDPIRTESFQNVAFENVDIGTVANNTNFTWEATLKCQSVSHDWGVVQRNNVMLLKASKPYLNFVRYPNQRNLYFHPTTFGGDTSSYEKLWTDDLNVGETLPAQCLNCWGSPSAQNMVYSGVSQGQYTTSGTFFRDSKWLYLGTNFANRGFYDDNPRYARDKTSRNAYINWPCIGFEDNIITNWNQIYTSSFDSVSRDPDITFPFLNDDFGVKHVGIVNGIPLLKVTENGCEVTYDIELKETNYNYQTGVRTNSAVATDAYVWFSDEPFTGWPNDQDCLDFEPMNNTCEKVNGTGVFSKAVKVPASQGGIAKVKIKVPTKNKYIWVKWTTHGEDGGGTLIIPYSCIVEQTE